MAIIIALFVSLFGAAPQDAPLFKSKVALVRVDAEVTDGTRTLDGLKQEDFRIFDKGSPVEIQHFSQDEEPLDIILLFDISGSMRPNIEKVAAAAKQALGELRAGDRVAVWTFNRRSSVLAPLSDDMKAIETTLTYLLPNMPFGGGTLIQTAVDDAAQFWLHEPKTSRRRAVLTFTDDYGMKTRREEHVVEHYWEADALLSELIIRNALIAAIHNIPTPSNLLRQALVNGTIQHIVEKTGGETIKANNAGDDFQQMMRRIRRRYTLYYTMPSGKPGEHHEIRVDLSDDAKKRVPGARVRARKGYLLPAS